METDADKENKNLECIIFKMSNNVKGNH